MKRLYMAAIGGACLATGLVIGGTGDWHARDYREISGVNERLPVERRISAEQIASLAERLPSTRVFVKMPGDELDLFRTALRYAEICKEPDRCPDYYRLNEAWGNSNYHSLPYVLTFDDKQTGATYHIVPAIRFKADDHPATVEPKGVLYIRRGDDLLRIAENGSIHYVTDNHRSNGRFYDWNDNVRKLIVNGAWRSLLLAMQSDTRT